MLTDLVLFLKVRNLSTYLARVTVQANFLGDEPDLPAVISDDLLVIDLSRRGNFTENHHHASLCACLASDLAVLVLFQAGV